MDGIPGRRKAVLTRRSSAAQCLERLSRADPDRKVDVRRQARPPVGAGERGHRHLDSGGGLHHTDLVPKVEEGARLTAHRQCVRA